MPSLGDHLLVALFAVVSPLYFMLDWSRGLRPDLENGRAGARLRFYRRCMIELWLLTAVACAWWLWSGRSPVSLGVGAPGGRAFWIGIVVVAALSTVLGYQVALVRSSPSAQAEARKQFTGVLALIVPRDERERRSWIGLSLTAGICEEVLYRGFLLWHAMAWLPGAVAVIVSAVVFGMAHLYLGWGAGVVRTSVVGVVFGAAYLLTGSLWVPIVLHAALDVASGLTGAAAFREGASGSNDGRA